MINNLQEKKMEEILLNFLEEDMQPWKELIAYYRCAIMEVETKFRVLNEEFSLQYDRNPIETIKTRIKSAESLIRKMKSKNLPYTVDAIEKNINDIAGIRVVCSFPEDIYMVAKCLLDQDDITLIERKDYILNPKESGYRSLHLIVEVPIFLANAKRNMRVEVQLRTIAMDFWASVEHKLRYKKDIPEEQAECLAQELRECAETIAQWDNRMQNIRIQLMESSDSLYE